MTPGSTAKERILFLRKERNFEEQLQHFSSHSKELDQLIAYISTKEEYPLPEYASWILVHLTRKKPSLIQPFHEQLIDRVFDFNNQSVLRNVINVLGSLSLTDYRESEFIDLLISFIQNHENKVALQVYSMYILIHFVRRYPELKNEVIEVIELNEQGKSAAYFAAKRHFISKTKKI